MGRDALVQEVEKAVAESRVVTLTGPGGVGKTRLAVESARGLVSLYPDGVWLCELAPIDDAASLIHAVAGTLGVDEQPGMSLRESLLSALSQRSSLVILDNCEHLLDPVAELVEGMVHAARTTHVLATSREPLGVEGERCRPIPPLDVADGSDTESDAVRLFSDRAGERRPEFAISPPDADIVAAICARLDGLPLAIELAAARVTSMTLPQIAEGLEDGFSVLRSDRRRAVDRHRSLQAAIDWSYNGLSIAEQRLFERLSVFAGGFALEAAEQVCGVDLDIDVTGGLASLIAKSLVVADVTGEVARYALLETLRQYARDRLADRGEADGMRRAHATHFAELFAELEELNLVDSERATKRALDELDNMREARGWAYASGDLDLTVRFVSGQMVQGPAWMIIERVGRGWAEDTLGMPGAKDHPQLADVLVAAAWVAWTQGDLDRARELHARALELLDDPDDARRLMPLGSLGYLALLQGDPDQARRWYDEHLRVARANRDRVREALGLSRVSQMESSVGRHEAALEMGEAGYAMAKDANALAQAFASYSLGEALVAAEVDLDRACACFERSVEIYRAHGQQLGVGFSLVGLASLHARHGDASEALHMFADLVDHWRLMGAISRQWVTLRNLVELFGRLGHDEAAATLDAAAEASVTAEPVLGPQRDRIVALREALAHRLGDAAFAAACERGRAMSDEEAVGFATTEIERARLLSTAP